MFCFGVAKPTKAPLVAMGLCGKTLACNLMQLARKNTSVTRYLKRARYVKLSVYKHDRAQNAFRQYLFCFMNQNLYWDYFAFI